MIFTRKVKEMMINGVRYIEIFLNTATLYSFQKFKGCTILSTMGTEHPQLVYGFP